MRGRGAQQPVRVGEKLTMRFLPAVILVLAALAGCTNGPTVPSDATKVAFQVVPEATVMVSGFREAAQFVVRDQPGWELMRAVREGRVLTVDSQSFQVPGPTIALAAFELVRSLGEMQRR